MITHTHVHIHTCIHFKGMEDGLTHTNELTGDHGGVASIMKELDERMTEEQRRKKQVIKLIFHVRLLYVTLLDFT